MRRNGFLLKPVLKMLPPYRRECWLGVALLWLLAGVLRLVIAPYLEALPNDYTAETHYLGKARTHQSPSANAEEFESTIRRHDQALTSANGRAMIQGDLHWLTPSGVVIFETINLYGVDRRTRENVSGYGSQNRSGQYLFPPHTAKKRYGFWDPNYAGPGVVTFERAEEFRGVETYVFNSLVDGIDETAGFVALPDIPGKYRALTFGQGRFWVEPLSGVVVNHEDGGTSYFVDAKNGQRIGKPIIQWTQRYTDETIEKQLQLALSTRSRMLAFEVWGPFLLVVAGMIWLGLEYRRRRKMPA